MKGVPGPNRLVFEVEVGNGGDVREFVYVDARNGKWVDQYTGIHDALSRRVYDGQNNPALPPPTFPNTPFWVEGDAFPSTGTCVQEVGLPDCNDEADNVILGSKETYDLYSHAFGRDSIDGAGGILHGIFDRGDRLPERVLERDVHVLLPGRHRRRHGRPRVGPRLHPVHPQPHLRVAAGRAQRGLLRHLGGGGGPHQRARDGHPGPAARRHRVLRLHAPPSGRDGQRAARPSPATSPRARPSGRLQTFNLTDDLVLVNDGVSARPPRARRATAARRRS